jgi:hypothetical protein
LAGIPATSHTGEVERSIMTPNLPITRGRIYSRIYEYALTKDDGVCYREDGRGHGWVCKYEKEEDDEEDDWKTDDGTSTISLPDAWHESYINNNIPYLRLLTPVWFMMHTPEYDAPDNLRIRYGHGVFNENLFREALLEREYMQFVLLRRPTIDTNRLVAFAKEFTNVGY